jgi:hypothetical protein
VSEDELILLARPKVRADCKEGHRPCPWISCRHHLADATVNERGRLHLMVLGPHDTLGLEATPDAVDDFVEAAAEAVVSMPDTCSLDVVDREAGGTTLEIVGNALSVTRERIRQLEKKSIQHLRPNARRALREGKPLEKGRT